MILIKIMIMMTMMIIIIIITIIIIIIINHVVGVQGFGSNANDIS